LWKRKSAKREQFMKKGRAEEGRALKTNDRSMSGNCDGWAAILGKKRHNFVGFSQRRPT
jgi:hypothetical protein